MDGCVPNERGGCLSLAMYSRRISSIDLQFWLHFPLFGYMYGLGMVDTGGECVGQVIGHLSLSCGVS